MTAARARRWVEPAAMLVASLVGSAALWGRLWVDAPSTRGLCGCGDPSLFQWFLAWPAHAIATGHSLVFSRDLFHPYGVNLLANTSMLALGLPLAPITWLGGPVLTQNVALLLSVPVAVVAMDLLLSRATASAPTRVALAALYGFSPYVVSSLSISHLMTAWIGFLPLVCLGVVDAVSDDAHRARVGRWLLGAALVVQFFVSTELLLLSAMVAGVVLVIAGVDWLAVRRPSDAPARLARALWMPLAVVGVLLVVPAYYALFGPRSLKGNIWGPGFNPGTGGTSLRDLVRPNAVVNRLSVLSGYHHPVVQMQYVGWGFIVAVGVFAVLAWRDRAARIAAVTTLVCLVLSLSPYFVSWAPWQWIGRLPVFQNVLQFRIVVFALLAGFVVVARGVEQLGRLGPARHVMTVAALALVAVPLVLPELPTLPLRTSHVTTPQWWGSPAAGAVVLAYPYPGVLLQSPLTWQSHSGFAASLLGGSGPQGAVSRAGPDAAATRILDDLSLRVAGRPMANAATAAPVREMVLRDGVTQVVVPVALHGGPLVTGAPPAGAAAFFVQVLGVEPLVERGAWVFHVGATLPPPRLGIEAMARGRCSAQRDPGAFARCVFEASR